MIFVDTSLWIAQMRPRDAHHAGAAALNALHSGAALVTSNLVIGETWAFLRRRGGHGPALQWLATRESRVALSVERIDPALEGEAWAWLRLHDERAYSFVAATSFALMQKLRIADMLAFDGDFAAAGFTELRP